MLSTLPSIYWYGAIHPKSNNFTFVINNL
uniref:Uncharacterized protein n=1 Tax=Rhizophora mucronata TaxID=61149 RepID=A0A2P2N1A1_RHIMU